MKERIPAILLGFVLASLAPNAFSQTQIELNRQAAAEFEKADAQLNDLYKRALASAAAVDKERSRSLSRPSVHGSCIEMLRQSLRQTRFAAELLIRWSTTERELTLPRNV
jgi:hypothetical protein